MKLKLLLCTLAFGAFAASACKEDVSFENDGAGGSGNGVATGGNGEGGVPSTSDKVDLLMVVDNSRGVSHMQSILSQSVPSLVRGLADMGVGDLHIGVLSSSLGGLGADACSGGVSASENDRGRLITRASAGGDVATYDNLGFLAWDPNQMQMPPGQADVDALIASTTSLIEGAGDVGCGYESPLESMYRFLIDPDPYLDIVLQNNMAVLTGTDDALLQQRAQFLRPDSLLMVVMATDENDCSTRAGGQFHFMRQIYQPGANSPYHLPAPRAACATDPNSECCRSCGQDPGPGCDTGADNCGAVLPALDDNINLRCFDQKRRFGIDFLWPIDRYTTGLTSAEVTDRNGNVTPNPLFAGGRSADLVVLAGIVGVPWQLVTRGADASAGTQTADEITTAGAWATLIGSPADFVPPSDAHMIESIDPRAGLPAPGSAYAADPYNGHEFSVPQRNDLQYACAWELPQSIDCTGAQNCECIDPSNDNPACQDPVTNAFGTTQFRAFARPGIRHLQVMQSLGRQAVVGSICPAQTNDVSSASYGFTPVFNTLLEVAKERLAP